MKTRTIRSGMLSLLAASLAFVVVSGFKPLPKKVSPSPALCNITFDFITSYQMAYSCVEDSNNDQCVSNSNGWSGTFGYTAGSVIFTVDLKSKNPAGTLTLTNVTTSTLIQSYPVPANTNAVYLLVAGVPNCNDHYEIKFQ